MVSCIFDTLTLLALIIIYSILRWILRNWPEEKGAKMPKAFDACVAGGGTVWTERGKKGWYRHLCRDAKGVHKGHWKKAKDKTEKKG